ncbi:hypothetical protein [Dyella sp. S184]|uniref:hypothetical protein n=1 Tax=Dyella sp. S184 TaxID=1641862 RepID=UPI0020B13736|nr:hypothetical protein [Dyella sp. S184]
MSFMRPVMRVMVLCFAGVPAWAVASNPPGSASATQHVVGQQQQVAVTAPAHPMYVDGLGLAVSADTLGQYSGGTNIHNNQNITGAVTGNSATQVVTGANAISADSFSGAAGLSTVIQNTGNNVLIQNGVIVNVQFKQ